MAADFGTPRRGAPSEPMGSPCEAVGSAMLSGSRGIAAVSPRLTNLGFGGGYPSEAAGSFPSYTGGSSGVLSPRNGGFASYVKEPPEVARRAAEWERQIESLDQKEMEIHQTQLRLIREQTTTFRGDLLAFQQELVDLKSLVLKHGAMHGDLASKVDGRMAYSERNLKELGDTVGKHAQLHMDGDRKLSSLADGMSEHQRALAHQGTMKERIDYMERLVGESFDKHARQLEDAHSKLEQLHGRLSGCEAGHGELKKLGADHSLKHASMGERAAYLERALGDSAEKHMRELENLKAATEKHMRETHGRQSAVEQAHATVQQRLQVLENSLGDSADKHMKELNDVKATMGKLSGGMQAHATVAERLAFIEQTIGDSAERHQSEFMTLHGRLDKLGGVHGSALEELKNAHGASAKDLATFAGHHATQNERVSYLEQVLGDSVEKHFKELEVLKASHGKLATDSKGHAQNHGAVADHLQSIAKTHATLEERMGYVERTMGVSAEKHARAIAALQAAHAAQASGSKDQQAKHASSEERLDYLERSLGDSADKHAAITAAQQAKLEHLHGKLTEQEKNGLKHAGDMKGQQDKHDQHKANVEERLGYIEKAVGDSFDKHYREIENVKGAHAKMAGEGKQQQMKHATLEDRLNHIENWFKGFKGT
mmetsp:Transcript_39443/g.126416  ORF Transcript_39443/g.126416 Transcript_39443/m.126416 type:complete len:657 (-) Transcript_39443:336-2306(-)